MEIPVRIVLVETSHPGNIGAVARAMKTMGIGDLALVRPKSFPDPEATARASGADDILANARVTDDLATALGDSGHVIGASARTRSGRWPVIDPKGLASGVVARLPDVRSAIVMGPEQSGVTNDDLSRCDALVHIPTSPVYGSLNLAMAVQVICYEIRMSALAAAGDRASIGDRAEHRDARPATATELEGFHAQLDDLLTRSGFLHPDHPKQLRLKLRRLFMRAELDHNEINILRGALSSLDPANAKRRQP